jgi:hypothetical protein
MEGLLTASKPAAEPAGNELIVPMICSRANVTVLVRFRRQFLGQTWKFENALVTGDGGKAGVEPAPMTVSVFEMDWRGAKCPVCKADCGPILCDCQRLGCHGGVSFSALNQRFYRCPCGAYGPIEPGLKSVSASKGMTAREAQVRATASEPAAPFGFLALPKPR